MLVASQTNTIQAGKMPTQNRTEFVRRKLRTDYEVHRTEQDQEKIQELLMLGETQLDNVLAQAVHLTECFQMKGMHAKY